MSDQLYQIAFTGQIMEGADLAKVKLNIAKMFKASDKQLEIFFSGKRVVIKNKIDEVTAKKYRAALNKAGAQCVIETISGEAVALNHGEKKVELAPAKEIPSEPIPATKKPVVSTVEVNSPSDEFILAPVGADIGVKNTTPPPSPPDVSHITVAEVGATIGEVSKVPPPPAPDTSSMSILPLGSDLSEKNTGSAS